MTRSILRTRQCDEDLLDIWLWITRDDPVAADHVIDTIERRWSQLVDQPFSGMARDDIAPGVRHLVSGYCPILYRVGR